MEISLKICIQLKNIFQGKKIWVNFTLLTLLSTLPINAIIYKVAKLENVAHLQITHAVALIIVSTALTMLGARIASNKDAVEALRSE